MVVTGHGVAYSSVEGAADDGLRDEKEREREEVEPADDEGAEEEEEEDEGEEGEEGDGAPSFMSSSHQAPQLRRLAGVISARSAAAALLVVLGCGLAAALLLPLRGGAFVSWTAGLWPSMQAQSDSSLTPPPSAPPRSPSSFPSWLSAPPPPPPVRFDPLPSCSVISYNLSHNLLRYQWQVQRPQVTSDCSAYAFTGSCHYEGRDLRPRWLVVRVLHGAGGLVDRLRSVLNVLGLALLLNRAFAIDWQDFIPLSHTHQRGVLEWKEWQDVQAELRVGSASSAEMHWESQLDHPFVKEDWRAEWSEVDVVFVHYNIQGFPDLLDNPHLSTAYRAFGFHAMTEKGDMDLYWECLMDLLFSFAPPVLDLINPLLTQLGRPRLRSWAERVAATPQLLLPPTAASLAASPPTHNQSLAAYRAQFVLPEAEGGLAAFQPLYCLQLRLGGSSSSANASSADASLGFTDYESFLSPEGLSRLFTNFTAMIDRLPAPSPPLSLNHSFFFTSDTGAHVQSIPPAVLRWPVLDIAGRYAHLDYLDPQQADMPVILQAAAKVVATHLLLGECDVAWVTESGFGPSAVWRRRNRRLSQPLRQAPYTPYSLIRKDYSIIPLVHRRGGMGRLDKDTYTARSDAVLEALAECCLRSEEQRKALAAEPFNQTQASAELLMEPPLDPLERALPYFTYAGADTNGRGGIGGLD